MSFAVAGPAVCQESYVVRSTADPCLNVRSAPDVDAAKIDCLPPGTPVQVIGSVAYWRRIVLPSADTGWAAKKFLSPSPTPTPQPPPTALPDSAWLEVHFVDVGQGDAIWIHTHDDGVDGNGIFEGRSIVIDGGPNSADASNELFKYLRDVAHHGAIIDAVILTHPHSDHYPGAETIFRHFEVRRYYDSGFPKGGPAYAAYLDQARAEAVEGQPAQVMIGRSQFQPFDWGGEIRAEVLFSFTGDTLGTRSNTMQNNASIVIRMEYGSHSFLFMGDAEGKERSETDTTVVRYVEKVLLDSAPPAKLHATVLKAGHHGSETSSTWRFIGAVAPQIVVIQSGQHSFGGRFLPDTTVIRRFCKANSQVRIYRTDRNDDQQGLTGTNDTDGDHILIRTNGDSLEVRAGIGGPVLAPEPCS